MKRDFRLVDHHTELPCAAQLHALDPQSKRLITVMPLAHRVGEAVCFYPNVQVTALNVAFQLARTEIERTLLASHPELQTWFDEHGPFWPWAYKNGIGPDLNDFDQILAEAKELVRLVFLIDSMSNIPFLESSCLTMSVYRTDEVRYSTLVELGKSHMPTLFVYERSSRTSSARTTMENFTNMKVWFYEIINLAKGNGSHFLFHNT